MALIKCPECGKDVSDKAPACIHCGYPFGQKESTLYNVVYKGFPSQSVIRLKILAFQ